MESKALVKRLLVVIVLAFFTLSAGTTAHAALKACGAPAPGTQGFPTFYQDLNGLSLGPCWDFNGFCTLLPPFCPPALGLGCIGTPINLNPAIPITPANFPVETFYFDATTVASFGVNHKARFTQVLALEGSFGGLPPVVAPGQQTTFLRINVRVVAAAGELVPNATYTVVQPYGTYSFSTDPVGIPVQFGGAGANRAVDGCAAAPCDFSLLLPAVTTNIGPFLLDTAGLHTDPSTGGTYIGPGPLAAVPVTGSPLGTNFVSITGPCANGGGAACLAAPVISTFTDSFFFLTGKVVGVVASPNAVTFAAQRPAIVSAPTVITVTNPDAVSAVTLGPVMITGASSTDFSIVTDTCSNATLAISGGTCTFGVTFSEPPPGANGTKAAAVNIPVTAPVGKPPVVINLAGAVIDALAANAGPNQIVVDKATLNGSASQGNIISWDWTLTHQTNPAYSLTVTGQKPNLDNLAAGFYDVRLTVSDGTTTSTASSLLAVAGPWDVDGDGKVGLAEVIYILQKMAGVR